ncbi:MAG: 16S rRNA (guanine1516-N2)-methyltransferase [Bermanella sp.]|jgi:16S rRNA (guanine1516-N2)-methyltransferase
MLPICLICTDKELTDYAAKIASRLDVPVFKQAPKTAQLVLELDATGLKLLRPNDKSVGALKVDFSDGALTWRRQHGGGTGQAIAKAIGLKQKKSLTVLDATAGTATDSFVLAALGCTVTLLERHPIVALLLEDALARAELTPEVYEITQNMTLYSGSSVEFMKKMNNNSVDVVFLDPMFPHSGKNAQVKKSMQYFREMVGKDEDADHLLAPALAAATYRVVVKRPKKSPFLDNQEPTLSHDGKANRFDIYVNKSMKE